MVDSTASSKVPGIRLVKRKVTTSNVVNSNSKSTKGPARTGSFHPELLDCPICCAPFTIPVFQCDNGHTACSSCCQRLAKKCPSCSLPTGSIRCLAIEAVLDSVKLHCINWRYGCMKSSSYGKTYLEHEKECESAPCKCPIPECKSNFSSTALHFHFSSSHKGVTVMKSFKYDQIFSVSFSNDDKFLVLVEQGGSVFLLNNNRAEEFGNVITVSRIAPLWSKQSYCYDVAAIIEGTRHTFRSLAKNFPGKYEGPVAPSFGFLVSAVDDNGKISLDICIWNHSSRPSAIPPSTTLPAA